MLSFKSFIAENYDYDEDLEEAHEKLDNHFARNFTNAGDSRHADQMRNVVPYPSHYPTINQDHLDDPSHLHLKDVPTHTLKSNQHEVSYDVVGGKLRGEIKEHYPEHPIVVHHEGTHYIYDGNHRACVAILKNEPHMKAYVYDAPKGTKLHEIRARIKAHPNAEQD